MRWWRRASAILRPGLDAGIAEELRHHAAMLEAEGMTASEAERRLGGALRLREASRDAWGWTWLERLRQDARIGLRQMRRAPGFTALAVAILGLGIGANSALFSVVDAALLRPLAYRDTGVVQFYGWLSDGQDVHAFAETAQYEPGELNLATGAALERVAAAEVTSSFFPLLGATVRQGRGFSVEDQGPGHGAVAILSHGLARELGGDEAWIGRTISLNGKMFTVIGIAPAGFDFPDHAQVWLPLPKPWSFAREVFSSNVLDWSDLGRLRPGATVDEARNELIAINSRPPGNAANARATIEVTPLRAWLMGKAGPMLWMLLGAVGLVLLIACADVANLQLARAAARQREIAVRAALGASRARLLRQHLTESLMLAAMGGGAGLLLAWALFPALRAMLPASLPLAGPLELDLRVLAWTAGAAMASGVAFGLFPALHACGMELRQAAEGGTRERGWPRRARNGLAVAEVGLALVLLTGAGLLLQSLVRLAATNPGFEPERLASTRLSLAGPAYTSAGSEIRFYQRLLPRMAALPGVEGAAVASDLPIEPDDLYMMLRLNVREPSAAPKAGQDGMFHSVSAGYFQVMRIPVLEGRGFLPNDRQGAPPVTIVNQTLARALWPQGSAVGKHLALPFHGRKPEWREIVGVVGDTPLRLGAEAKPAMYLPLVQSWAPSGFLLLRSTLPTTALAAEVRRAVKAVDATIPVANFTSEATRVRQAEAAPRFRTILLTLFAALALVLSAGGIFGVMAYWAARRRQEIGIRMALGAKPEAVMRLVVGEGMRLVAWGIGVGTVGALALGQVLGHFLYQVAPRDPATMAAAAATMAAVGALACYWPAWRAARLDPLAALRHE